jgi:hypothetical protein
MQYIGHIGLDDMLHNRNDIKWLCQLTQISYDCLHLLLLRIGKSLLYMIPFFDSDHDDQNYVKFTIYIIII